MYHNEKKIIEKLESSNSGIKYRHTESGQPAENTYNIVFNAEYNGETFQLVVVADFFATDCRLQILAPLNWLVWRYGDLISKDLLGVQNDVNKSYQK